MNAPVHVPLLPQNQACFMGSGEKVETSPRLRQELYHLKCLPLPSEEKEGSALKALLNV